MAAPDSPSARPARATAALTRRGLLRAAGGWAAVLGCPSVVRGAPQRQRVRVLVGRDQSLCHLPVTVASELGYLAAEGLEATFIEVPSPAAALAALHAGQAEFAAGAFLQVVLRQLMGDAVQSVVVEGRSPIATFGVSARVWPEFKSVADLKGRRIGTSVPGTLSELLARVVLARAGVQPQDVTWTPLAGMREAVLAVRSGRVDALSHIDPGVTQLEQKGDLRLVADPRTMKGARELFGGPLPGSCLYAATGYVERHREVCQALAHGVVRALKWLQTAQPQDLIATVPESHFADDRALYLASFYKVRESYSVDGVLAADAVRATAYVAGALAEASGAGLDAALERSHTNEFALKARARWFKT